MTGTTLITLKGPFSATKVLTIFCEGLRPRLTPRWRGAFDFGCSPQGANKNAPPNGVCTARQACALGCEGIVSKRLGSAYRSGRADCWLEVKNPKCARGHARGRRGLELLSHGSAITRTTFPTYYFPAHAAFPDMAVGSAFALSFPRLARRSLALRPAHSRCHRIS